MKVLLLIAATAALSFAEDVKPPKEPVAKSTPAAVSPAVPELIFSPDEVKTFRLALKDIAIISEKYKLTDFYKEIEPFNAQQRAVFLAKCQELGIPIEKIQAGECDMPQFLDNKGDLLKRPDGAPVTPKVVWRKSEPAAPVQAKK